VVNNFVEGEGNDWNKYLSLIKYAHATFLNTSIQFSSSQIDTGSVAKNPMFALENENPSAPRSEFIIRILSERENIIKQSQDNSNSQEILRFSITRRNLMLSLKRTISFAFY